MHFSYATLASLLALTHLVAGHGAIIKATGDAGGSGSAIGINPDTPRTGSTKNPFEQDTTRFKGQTASQCGETLEGGANDIESGTQTVLSQNGGTLPQISQGGQIMMTLHQVNGDGAGPYTCMIDSTGTGTQWAAIDVTMQVPGTKGDSKAKAEDFPLNAAVPQDQTCTGNVAGQSNVCMVKCMNPAKAGPFGGCVPVQMSANGTTAAANPAPAAPAASSSAANTDAGDGADDGADAGAADSEDDDSM